MNEHLIEIYNRLKPFIKKYENKGSMTAKIDLDSRYDLWSIKDLIIDGRKRKEVFFAGLIIQSSYVGFYFMPVYSDIDAELKDVFGQELLKLLKGKSCFHIKKLDETIEKQIIEALEIGYKLYKERGWID
jgi:hypothetical protein